MKKLIVLALVLGMVSSASAVVYDLDLSTTGAWLTGGVANGSEPAGFTFNSDWTINGGYAEVKAYQDLGGGDYGNALELGATDSGNGMIYIDTASLGLDIQDAVYTVSVRYKEIGALPADAGPRFGVQNVGANANSRVSYTDKQWGDYASDVSMRQLNTDVYFLSDDGVTYTPGSGSEAVIGAINAMGTWNEMSYTVQASGITYTVNGTTHTYTDFRDNFGNGDLVNLGDAIAFPRADLALCANGIVQVSALSVETIPEPATIALLGMGALALIRKRR